MGSIAQKERGFSITTASGGPASASIQEKIRIKQEQREHDENSLANAKNKLASLPNSIVLQKVSENGPATHTASNASIPTPSTTVEYTPPPGITMTKPASQASPAAAQPTPVNIRNILDVTKLSAEQRNSELLKA